MYLTQSLHRSIQRYPRRTALICGARQLSYAVFAHRVAKWAGALQTLGVTPGDRVSMLGLNSDRYVEYYYGTWWAGAVVNPVNIRWSAAEVAYSLDDCETRILLVDDQFKGIAADLRHQSKALQTLIYVGDGDTPEGMLRYESLLDAATPVPDARRSGNELAAVMYTGGTTGFPKGVMLSHQNLYMNALGMVSEQLVPVDGDCRALLIAPMFHIAAAAVMLAYGTVGATLVVAPVFSPKTTLQMIRQYEVTHALLVPTMIQMTVDHPEAGQYDLSSVSTLIYGGSVISEAVLQR